MKRTVSSMRLRRPPVRRHSRKSRSESSVRLRTMRRKFRLS